MARRTSGENLQSAHLFQVEIFRLATVGNFGHEFVGHHNAAVRLVELLKALGMDFFSLIIGFNYHVHSFTSLSSNLVVLELDARIAVINSEGLSNRVLDLLARGDNIVVVVRFTQVQYERNAVCHASLAAFQFASLDFTPLSRFGLTGLSVRPHRKDAD